MPQLVAGWIASGLTSIGVGSTLAGALGSIGGALLFSAASRALAGGGQSSSDMRQDLRMPRSLPPKRSAYGRCRMPASWLPPIVKDGVLYGCCILNSRPSDGGDPVIMIDRREVAIGSGLTNFATGASATASPFSGHAKFWLGLGDQTAPPAQIMTEVGDATSTDTAKFWPTDALQGVTVLWVRLVAGDNSSRQERWQSNPPQIDIEMNWSKVWDPRDEDQGPDDPDSWTWSDNQALCTLDAIRTNPIRRRPLAQIMLDDFVLAAGVADEAVPLSVGGSEPRYRLSGFLVWSRGAELLDQLAPMFAAGGGVPRQVGGKVGYLPGKYFAPAVTIGDVLDTNPLRHTSRRPSRDVPDAFRGTFPDPGQEWEDADLSPIAVTSRNWDGGDDGVQPVQFPLVPYARQAQRLTQIMARQAAQEGRLSCVLPPECLDLVVGARVTVDLGGDDVRNGVWMVETLNPHAWMNGDGGVAFRLDADLRRDQASVWAWDPADEQELYSAAVLPLDLSLPPPEGLGFTLNLTGDLTFHFDTVVGPGFYEWQIMPDGTGIWQPKPDLTADLAVSGVITTAATVAAATDIEIRVRSRLGQQASSWVTITATPS
jgi:hypothetical protein